MIKRGLNMNRIDDTIALQINSDERGDLTMANNLLQLRIDEKLKQEATEIYSQLGLDLPTAIRIFLTRSVQMKGIPFSFRRKNIWLMKQYKP